MTTVGSMLRRSAVLAAALVFSLPGAALAADGDLDPSFSGDGKAFVDFARIDYAYAVAVQPDGRIVTAGEYERRIREWDMAVARLNPDGSPDTTFSGDGKVTTSLASGRDSSDIVYALAVQRDGRIVTGGLTHAGGTGDMALVRYRPNGSLDRSFGGDGTVVTDFAGDSDYVAGLAIQPDGKIVAAGGTSDADNADFALTRYLPNGTLDASFGTGGKVTTRAGSNGYAVQDVFVQPDGKIVAIGTGFTVARYRPNGTLDSTFSGDGIASTSFGPGLGFESSGGRLQPDGRIVAAGNTFDSRGQGNYDFALARFTSSGALDTTFGGDGKVTTEFGLGPSGERAFDVAIQADGKIVAVGGFAPYIPPGSAQSAQVGEMVEQRDFLLARYNPNGTLDLSFGGGDGLVVHGVGGGTPYAVAIAPDGRIVAAGTGHISGDFAVTRYRA